MDSPYFRWMFQMSIQRSVVRWVRALRILGGILFVAAAEALRESSPELLNLIPFKPLWVTHGLIVVIAVVLLVLSATLFLLSYSVVVIQLVAGIYRSAVSTLRHSATDYELRFMSKADLSVVYPVYQRIFGEDLIPADAVALWMSKNPMIAYKVVRRPSGRAATSELVGFFELLPLTKSGESKLRGDNPNTGSLSLKDIFSATHWDQAKAYYIASVGIVESPHILKESRRQFERLRAEGTVMKMLVDQLRRLGARSTIDVYARPITRDGLRLVKEYGFHKRQEKLPDDKAIWSGEVNIDSEPKRVRKAL
jgi:hypothetical protein